MNDDIVTRLRDGLFYEVWDDTGIHWKSDIKNKDIWEAIKEIERLRAELNELHRLALIGALIPTPKVNQND